MALFELGRNTRKSVFKTLLKTLTQNIALTYAIPYWIRNAASIYIRNCPVCHSTHSSAGNGSAMYWIKDAVLMFEMQRCAFSFSITLLSSKILILFHPNNILAATKVGRRWSPCSGTSSCRYWLVCWPMSPVRMKGRISIARRRR